MAGGLNLYGFADGDPVNFSDPFGLCATCGMLGPNSVTLAVAGAIGVKAEPELLIGVVPEWISPRGVWSLGRRLWSGVRGLFRGRAAARGAYEIAKGGGRHSGYYRSYAGRSTREIRLALQSHEANVAQHAEKLANPARHVSNWSELSRVEQEGIKAVWQRHLTRNREQAEIMRGLLGER